MSSKTGQILQEGQKRIAAQILKVQETEITPQLERMQQRSQRLLTRLTTDKKIKDKALEFFQAAQSRIVSSGNLETWISGVKDQVVSQLNVHRAMLVKSLGGLNLQEVDLRQLIVNS